MYIFLVVYSRMSVEGFAEELAAKAYTRRAADHPEEISSEMEQTLAKESLEDLSVFIQQLTDAGKKVVLSIEFGICRFERFRFYQITNLLIKNAFQNYDEEIVYVILGVDSEFTNEKMLRTMQEVLDEPLRGGYELVDKDTLHEYPNLFQVTPLLDGDKEVVKGTSNLYSFKVEESEEDLNAIYGEPPILPDRNEFPKRTIPFYTYFLKHTIQTSYFHCGDDATLYYKAQKSATVKHFSRKSKPILPFWKGLEALCLKGLYKIFYANIAHYDGPNPGFVGGAVKRGYRARAHLRTNKYSEKMSEIWYILFTVRRRKGTPTYIVDLDLESNRTFQTEDPVQLVRLTDALSFKKEDEVVRIQFTKDQFASMMDFIMREPGTVEFDNRTVAEIDWNEVCPDPPDAAAANGGRRKRKTKKSKKHSTKTKRRRSYT
jgi:hypothetical protein